ncbi:conserved exported hypothetical protein [Gammaproteobacteria bacterium]
MLKQSVKTTGIALALVGAATFSQVADADSSNIFDWMNPFKWFSNNDRRYDDCYYDRDRYGHWGDYGPGWGGYPGYVVAVQPTDKEPSRPRVPE